MFDDRINDLVIDRAAFGTQRGSVSKRSRPRTREEESEERDCREAERHGEANDFRAAPAGGNVRAAGGEKEFAARGVERLGGPEGFAQGVEPGGGVFQRLEEFGGFGQFPLEGFASRLAHFAQGIVDAVFGFHAVGGFGNGSSLFQSLRRV